MGRYMLSVIHPEGDASVHGEVDMEAVFAAVGALNEQWMAEDRMLFGAGLKPPSSALTVTVSEDFNATMVTDGPFAEAKEGLGGFWIVRAEESEIEDMARAAAMACRTTIEVRALEDEPEE